MQDSEFYLKLLPIVISAIQAVFLAVSVAFVWYQLRKQTKLSKAANAQALVDMISPLRIKLINDKELATLYLSGATEYNAFDPTDKFRYRRLISWGLTFYENIHYQKQNELLDEEIYGGWKTGLDDFVKQRMPECIWNELKSVFNEKFVKVVDEIPKEHLDSCSCENRQANR